MPTPASSTTGTLHGFADQGDVVRVADAHAAADRRAERHHRGAADVDQPAREHGVVGRVGQHHEAVVDELLGGPQQLGRVGQQRVLVADHLELDPVGLERLAREPGREHGVARGVAAGGVRQQLDPRSASTSISEPRRVGVRRDARSATVTSSLPLAAIASASSSARGSRPCRAAAASAACVRRSSARRRGAAPSPLPTGAASIGSRIAPSSSLHRGQHLHARVRRAARTSPSRARGTTSPSTATATPRASRAGRAARAPPPRSRRRAASRALAVEVDHESRHRSARRSRDGCGRDGAPPRSARGAHGASARRAALAGEQRHHQLGGERGEQDAVAVVARRPRQARRARPARSPERCPGVPGRRPTHSSSICSSLTPGTSSWASRSSS